MDTLELTPPLLAFVVATRAALGLGIGLLIADKIPRGPAAHRRHDAGRPRRGNNDPGGMVRLSKQTISQDRSLVACPR